MSRSDADKSFDLGMHFLSSFSLSPCFHPFHPPPTAVSEADLATLSSAEAGDEEETLGMHIVADNDVVALLHQAATAQIERERNGGSFGVHLDTNAPLIREQGSGSTCPIVTGLNQIVILSKEKKRLSLGYSVLAVLVGLHSVAFNKNSISSFLPPVFENQQGCTANGTPILAKQEPSGGNHRGNR